MHEHIPLLVEDNVVHEEWPKPEKDKMLLSGRERAHWTTRLVKKSTKSGKMAATVYPETLPAKEACIPLPKHHRSIEHMIDLECFHVSEVSMAVIFVRQCRSKKLTSVDRKR